MIGWHHSGFNVYYGESIWLSDQEGIERLAQYIVRATIAQERLMKRPSIRVIIYCVINEMEKANSYLLNQARRLAPKTAGWCARVTPPVAAKLPAMAKRWR